MSKRKNPSKKSTATSAHGSKKQKQSSSGNSQAPFRYQILTLYSGILNQWNLHRSSLRGRGFSCFRRPWFLAALVLGVQFTIFGAEGDPSGIATVAQTTSRDPCQQVLFFAVLRNFKILQSDPETAPIFHNPPLVSFKRNRNLRNSVVRSSLPSNLEPGTFNYFRKVCNTCPFISSKTHIRGPNESYQVNDHFDCTTSNIIYCITCTLCNKLYIGESGRKLGDRFREHLLDVKNKGSDLSKPVARHFNLPGHSQEHMEICGIYLHLGNNETRKGKNRA